MRARRVLLAVAVALTWLAMPTPSLAQSAIAGAVRDSTGAVLPGVTVEAASPALIEKVRTVVSNEAGQYKIAPRGLMATEGGGMRCKDFAW
jgi:hypothetical protein